MFDTIRNWLFPEEQPIVTEVDKAAVKLAWEVHRANRLRNVLVANLAKAKGISYFRADEQLKLIPRSEWSLPETDQTLQVEGIRGTATSQSITPGWDILIDSLDEEELTDCRANWNRYVALIGYYHDHGYWEGEQKNLPRLQAGNIVHIRLTGTEYMLREVMKGFHFTITGPWKIIQPEAIYAEGNGVHAIYLRMYGISESQTQEKEGEA
jgi:hypothetical protein